MTKFQLSCLLNVSEEEAEMIEEGGMSLTTDQLEKLCNAFQCTEDHILGFDKGYIEPAEKGYNEEVAAAAGLLLNIAQKFLY